MHEVLYTCLRPDYFHCLHGNFDTKSHDLDVIRNEAHRSQLVAVVKSWKSSVSSIKDCELHAQVDPHAVDKITEESDVLAHVRWHFQGFQV